jgi:hypothetical protein
VAERKSEQWYVHKGRIVDNKMNKSEMKYKPEGRRELGQHEKMEI